MLKKGFPNVLIISQLPRCKEASERFTLRPFAYLIKKKHLELKQKVYQIKHFTLWVPLQWCGWNLGVRAEVCPHQRCLKLRETLLSYEPTSGHVTRSNGGIWLTAMGCQIGMVQFRGAWNRNSFNSNDKLIGEIVLILIKWVKWIYTFGTSNCFTEIKGKCLKQTTPLHLYFEPFH